LFSLCTTIGFDLSFSRKSWHFRTRVAVSGSMGYFETEVEREVEGVGADGEVVEVEVEGEVECWLSEGGSGRSGGRWER
jgi:hypothetical protein